VTFRTLWTTRTVGGGRSVGSWLREPAEEMPRNMKVREVIGLIEDDGWVLSRTRGSHRQYKHPDKPGLVTVPGALGRDLPIGLQRSILRQAGLLGDQR
jgi:predicted RNA binding protein YcfA (HicA-like mRNA interferase family)